MYILVEVDDNGKPHVVNKGTKEELERQKKTLIEWLQNDPDGPYRYMKWHVLPFVDGL